MNKPSRKIGAAGLAGAGSILLVWIVGLAGLEVPGEVASALTTVMTFATGYFVKS